MFSIDSQTATIVNVGPPISDTERQQIKQSTKY
jgi:hypothetical protein